MAENGPASLKLPAPLTAVAIASVFAEASPDKMAVKKLRRTGRRTCPPWLYRAMPTRRPGKPVLVLTIFRLRISILPTSLYRDTP